MDFPLQDEITFESYLLNMAKSGQLPQMTSQES
jgi:hypothetical protein